MANLEKVFEGVISNKDTLQKHYAINTKIGSELSKIAELKKQRVRLSVDLTKKLIDEYEYVILRDRYKRFIDPNYYEPLNKTKDKYISYKQMCEASLDESVYDKES